MLQEWLSTLPRFALCSQRGCGAALLAGTDPFLEDVTRNAGRVFYFDEGPRASTKLISKAYPKAQKRIRVNPRLLELQTAKEILAEIFHARPGEVEVMIQNRLEERSWREESWPDEEGLWPERFFLSWWK